MKLPCSGPVAGNKERPERLTQGASGSPPPELPNHVPILCPFGPTVNVTFAELVDAHKRPDHFFSQVFPLSALLQISWLVVESTTSAASRTSM